MFLEMMLAMTMIAFESAYLITVKVPKGALEWEHV
jgi:hypothetical protein